MHLEEAATAPAEDSSVGIAVAPVTQPAGRQAVPWTLGALVVGSVVTGLAVWSLTRPAVEPLTRLTVTVPEGLQPFDPRVSPDGRMIAFEGRGGGQSQVYLRFLDQLEASTRARCSRGGPKPSLRMGNRSCMASPGNPTCSSGCHSPAARRQRSRSSASAVQTGARIT